MQNHYFDVQINGYVGVDFNDPGTSVEQVELAARTMQSHGVVTAFPTVITASEQTMTGCVANLLAAIQAGGAAGQVFRGIHLEGPFLSPESGYIGAHPKQHASPANLDLLKRLHEATEGFLRLVTLAPEVDQAGALTRYCVAQGVHVAAGHTNASLQELEVCMEQGLDLFTHFGNGCPPLLPRHDNILLRALAKRSQLRFTVIADGFHVPSLLFRHLLDWMPADRMAVVSDAISAAGLGPGEYPLGGRTVHVGADKAARDVSGDHFVGSAATMQDADHWLSTSLSLDDTQRQALLYDNAAKWFA